MVVQPAPDLAEGGGGEKIGPENQTIDDVSLYMCTAVSRDEASRSKN